MAIKIIVFVVRIISIFVMRFALYMKNQGKTLVINYAI